MPKRSSRSHPTKLSTDDLRQDSPLRIVGGQFRSRKLAYHGDPVTRPMKQRVREAIFNLVGIEAEGRHALDLFAGTGALGLEALSRGAARATFIEKHIPTARVVQQNIATLEVEPLCELRQTSAFLWGKRDLPTLDRTLRWLVFISPPYAFFVDRQQDLLELIAGVAAHAPAGSTLIVEADDRFDFDLLTAAAEYAAAKWDLRTYAPAVVGVWRKPELSPTAPE